MQKLLAGQSEDSHKRKGSSLKEGHHHDSKFAKNNEITNA